MATKKKSPAREVEWIKHATNSNAPPEVVELIERRRRQMLVHCFIYYQLDDNLISDHDWMRMAQELADLQSKYGTKFGFYDSLFANWDGSSGYQLSYDAECMHAAMKLLANRTNGDV